MRSEDISSSYSYSNSSLVLKLKPSTQTQPYRHQVEDEYRLAKVRSLEGECVAARQLCVVCVSMRMKA